MEELTGTVFNQIDSLKTAGPGDEYIAKVKEIQQRNHEEREKTNGAWLNVLWEFYFAGSNPVDFIKYPELVESLTTDMVREAANMYFNTDNYVRVFLLPEPEQAEKD